MAMPMTSFEAAGAGRVQHMRQGTARVLWLPAAVSENPSNGFVPQLYVSLSRFLKFLSI
jgi:hypothetical protein